MGPLAQRNPKIARARSRAPDLNPRHFNRASALLNLLWVGAEGWRFERHGSSIGPK